MPEEMNRREQIETLLSPTVIETLAESIPGFDRAGLLAGIIESFGGQDAFARAQVQEFNNAKPGSMTRQRLMEMWCRLLSQEAAASQHLTPVEEMESEEIHRAILAMAPELARTGVRLSEPPAEE